MPERAETRRADTAPAGRTWGSPMRRRLAAGASVLFAALLLAGCGTPVVNPVTGKTERSVMTEADEIAEGRKAHPQIVQEYGRVDDARLQAYVSEIGQRLARQSHRAQLPWTFTVLDSPEVNAFALPGGYVYVTRGILAHLGSEAELAGVLGHEIGHVTARHSVNGMSRELAIGLGAAVGLALLDVDEAGQELASLGLGLMFLKFSRSQEQQADQLGVRYVHRAGLDPLEPGPRQGGLDLVAPHGIGIDPDRKGVLRRLERLAERAARREGARRHHHRRIPRPPVSKRCPNRLGIAVTRLVHEHGAGAGKEADRLHRIVESGGIAAEIGPGEARQPHLLGALRPDQRKDQRLAAVRHPHRIGPVEQRPGPAGIGLVEIACGIASGKLHRGRITGRYRRRALPPSSPRPARGAARCHRQAAASRARWRFPPPPGWQRPKPSRIRAR